ncbi:MAG: hypothetical protein ABEJ31_10385 [Haloarculaceae archaeon]
MDTGFTWGTTKVWECAECGARNVTTERDVFSDQCRTCTMYNEVDWTAETGTSLREARAALDGRDQARG